MANQADARISEYHSNVTAVMLANLLGLGCIGAFLLWAYVDVDSLNFHALEDGVIENVSALLFFMAALAMGAATIRHPLAHLQPKKWRLLFLLGWAALFFVFAGEEISWGQRIFGIETPDVLKDGLGGQDELNIHNLAWVNEIAGGKFRWLSILVLTTGFLMPVAKQVRPVRNFFTKIGMPVVQLHYVSLFVGGYLFTKYTFNWISHADEVRELLFALGYFLFAFHGAIFPLSILDYLSPPATEPSQSELT